MKLRGLSSFPAHDGGDAYKLRGEAENGLSIEVSIHDSGAVHVCFADESGYRYMIVRPDRADLHQLREKEVAT